MSRTSTSWSRLARRTLTFLAALATLGVARPHTADAQTGTRVCDAAPRTRAGNILEGVCYARSDFVTGNRQQINDTCEQLIRLGTTNDLGDVHLAHNVCKGIADHVCDHGGFDAYGGPFVMNAACRAAQNRCAEVRGDDLRMCNEVRALMAQGLDMARRSQAGGTRRVGTMVLFRLPVEEAGLIESAWTSEPWNLMKGPFLVDHSGSARGLACKDYMNRGAGGPLGIPYCYGGHTGSDFILRGGFGQMDVPNANWVVAAANGVVESVVDNLYDRCHAEAVTADLRFFNVDCDGQIDGGPSKSNFAGNNIVIRHADGTRATYYHIRKASAVVRAGQTVHCNDRIARIGSSGISSMPHLHFELHDAAGALLDPFAGPASQAQSRWMDQGPDYRRIPVARCMAT